MKSLPNDEEMVSKKATDYEATPTYEDERDTTVDTRNDFTNEETVTDEQRKVKTQSLFVYTAPHSFMDYEDFRPWKGKVSVPEMAVNGPQSSFPSVPAIILGDSAPNEWRRFKNTRLTKDMVSQSHNTMPSRSVSPFPPPRLDISI